MGSDDPTTQQPEPAAAATDSSQLPAASKSALDLEPLVRLGQALLGADARLLRAFVEYFVDDPNRLRWQLLGQSALRRRQLSPIQRRALDIMGHAPDLLGPMRGRFDERLHTEVIAWALNPRTEALGGRPLKRLLLRVNLLRAALGIDEPLPLSVATAVVTSELTIGQYGRVDICVESDAMLVLVEAKVLAAEGESQLPNYIKAAQHRAAGRPWSVVFLTANAEQKPSVDDIPHLTLRELLADWLPVAAGGMSSDHEYLCAYLASVARVVKVGSAGDFDDWDFYARRRALDLLESGVNDE